LQRETLVAKRSAKLRAWPADSIERWKLDKIVPYERNPRLHSEEQIGQIAESMKRFGVTTPVLVDEDGELIYGHGRLAAAKLLGLRELPVAIARGWSDAEKRAYRIADNQLGLNSEWDLPLLKIELGALADSGFDMPLLGFDDMHLVQFMAGEGEGRPLPTAEEAVKTLAESFGVVPFSVFNAREGWWQDRKRAWIALGIQSELGRGENLLEFSDSVRLDGKAYNERFKGKSRPALAAVSIGGEV
jgi:hypothetical protein